MYKHSDNPNLIYGTIIDPGVTPGTEVAHHQCLP